ncbi:hypothetical protein wTkk_000077 [Wolbachia endosymbiont of Trichogramma kaykai]
MRDVMNAMKPKYYSIFIYIHFPTFILTRSGSKGCTLYTLSFLGPLMRVIYNII